MTFQTIIYADYQEDIINPLKTMKKKLNKLDCTLEWDVSNSYLLHFFNGEKLETPIRVRDVMVSCSDVKYTGWTVLAVIDHHENGNIIRACDALTIDKKWFSTSSNCDHCNTNRSRNTTILVQNEQGEIKQVGKSCLKSYTGINPLSCISFATLKDMLNSYIFNGEESNSHRVYSFCVTDVLSCAVQIINENGYAKSSEYNSTKNLVLKALPDCRFSKQEIKNTMDIIETILNMENDDNFCINLQNICKNNYCNVEHIGFLCYAPILLAKIEAEKQRKQQASLSSYVGEVGAKITKKVKIISIHSFDTMYGVSVIHNMKDENGNSLMWKTNKVVAEQGEEIVISGTIKDLNEFRNEKQTVLTRCRVKIAS